MLAFDHAAAAWERVQPSDALEATWRLIRAMNAELRSPSGATSCPSAASRTRSWRRTGPAFRRSSSRPQNTVDLEEIPESIRGELIFHPVERLDEAMEFAFRREVKTDRVGEGVFCKWHRLPASRESFPYKYKKNKPQAPIL